MNVHTTQCCQPSPMNRHSAVTSKLSSVNGKVNFQAKFISWSCRRRGSVPRIQIKTKMKNRTFAKNHIHEGTQARNDNGADQPPRKSVAPRPERENMARYP